MHLIKLYLIPLTLLFLLVPVVAFSQKAEYFSEINPGKPETIPEFLQNRITVHFKETTIDQALGIIAEQGGFHLNYNQSQMLFDKEINLDQREEKALDVLLAVLKDARAKLMMNSDGTLIIKPSGKSKQITGMVKGRVIDEETQNPLIGTNIVVVGKGMGGTTDTNGEYFISKLPAGEYSLEFSYIGYKEKRFDHVIISSGNQVVLDVALDPAPLHLNEIVVTPGQFAVMGKEPIVRQTLTKQSLETIPFGEDIYRAITRLPGVSANDFSAKFTIRGGKSEEILALMDGQELYEPFHLKDVYGGVLSIIDVEAIKGIDLYTGGYGAEYGECMSGVFNMKSNSSDADQFRTEVGISFMNARIMSEGSFHQNKGSWLFSARRGYLDVILKIMEEESPPQPIYYDVFSKLRYRISHKNTISVNILHSGDKVDFVDDDDDGLSTRYGNSYGWFTLNSIINSRLLIRSIFSFGRLSHTRNGIGYFDYTGVVHYTVADENQIDIFGLKQDWDLELLDNWFLKWGFYYNYQTANYDYLNTLSQRNWIDENNYVISIDSTAAYLNPEGARYGGYVSNRFRLLSPFTIEVGLRYDHNVYTDDHYLSPRVNFVYTLGKQTFLRSGWGYFYQSQRMHEIKVAYGETDFFPAQLSRHWVAGLEHTFHNVLNFRLEAYYKNISDLRPDHRTFSNTIEMFPEVEEDRFSMTFNGAKSKGLEFYLKYDPGRKISFWTSYALAYADEEVQDIIYAGEEPYTLEDPVIPNQFDQRHTVYLDFNFRPNRHWHLNFSWQYHTGWPYTRQVVRSQQLPDGSNRHIFAYDNLYGSKFPPYHRLDLQLSRHFYFTRSRLSIFLAIINMYNRDNLRNIKFSRRIDPDGIPYLVETKEYWFHLLPSLGVSWTLGR